MLRSIVVDDEAKSRESLKILVEEFCQEVSVDALCQNVDEAMGAIDRVKPDVIFLDIQLQRETGFDLLARYQNINFDVIFTTAYSEYAIKAFKFSAIDYLLKPVDVNELKAAISKVRKREDTRLSERLEQLEQNLKGNDNYKLGLPTFDGLVFVKVSEILYCEAASNYTELTLLDNRKYVVTRTLKDYEELLSGHGFYRIHHSYLINLDAVKKYVRGEGGYVIMANDKSLDVSKRKKDGFLERIRAKF